VTGEQHGLPLAADIWHRQLAAGRSGDWAALETILAADCVWGVITQRAAFRGRDEVIGFIREGFDAAATRDEPDVRNEFSTSEWGVYEYTSRGTIDRNRATVFAKRLTGERPIITGQSHASSAAHWPAKRSRSLSASCTTSTPMA
jgi:hypothetical protein